MSRADLTHVIGGDAWTWSSPYGLDFWPSVLDVGMYDATRAQLVESFLLDSAELNDAERAALGLLTADSAASDHLFVVLDFGSGRPCDTNCDGSVNQFDIQSFVQLISQAGAPCSACAGDANGDGSINQFDIQQFVECLGG